MSGPSINNWLCRSVILVVAAVGAAWLGVRWGASLRRTESPSPAAATPPRLPPSGFASPSKIPLPVQAWVKEIERETNPTAQAAAAARLAARLQPDEWPLALTHLDDFSLHLTRAVLEAAVVRRWAKHDPEAAAAWGLKHSGILAAVAAGEWVKSDVESATAWFEALTPPQRAANQVQGAYYLALVKRDEDAGFASILAHANDPQFNVSSVQRELVAIAPERALALSESTNNKELRESIRSDVAREYGKRDPSAAVAWVQQQPDADVLLAAVFQQHREPPARMIPALADLTPDEQKQVLAKSWPWWERGDPFATLEALRSAPVSLSEESRHNLITRLMQSMTSHYDIAESVRRLQSEWGDFAGLWERRVAAEWAQRDPAAALAWIEHLPSGPIRDQALAAHGDAVSQRTKEAAPRDPSETALRMLSRPPTNLGMFGSDPFVHTASRHLNRLDSEERLQLWERAASLPVDQKTRARENLLTLTAMTDPQEAASWLNPQHGDPPDATLASRLAANWALDDAPAAARWTTSLPEGEAKLWATWNLARQWHRVDAPAVQQWAKSQPPSTRAVVDRAVAGHRPGQ